MEYFRIRQDPGYNHPPFFSNVQDVFPRRKSISLDNASKIERVNVLYSNKPYPLEFIDVLDRQVFLVSMEVKQVFSLYEPAMVFKEVCVLNLDIDEYGRYALPLFKEIDCLSPDSKISPDKTAVKELKIKRPPADISIFKVAGLLTDVVLVRLDVVESLLRRKHRKFVLEQVYIDR